MGNAGRVAIEATGDPRVGIVVQERYRILRRLGEGGMGIVYEAEHVLIRRRFAIKCLHPMFAEDAETLARFHREALAATQIGNEHIVDVTDMGRFPDGAVYIALELLSGHDLADELDRSGPLPVHRACHILAQLCDALGAAHSKGIVHRDLKPENIFLTSRHGDPDFVKVLDFGISKFVDSEDVPGGRGLTRTGSTMGTPHYMAPEQAEGRKSADHRVDIFALGVILYRMLTADLPFAGSSIPQILVKICSPHPAPRVRQLRRDISPALDTLVARALEKDPRKRLPDCATFKRELLLAVRELDQAPTQPSVSAVSAPDITDSETLPLPAAEPDRESTVDDPAPAPSDAVARKVVPAAFETPTVVRAVSTPAAATRPSGRASTAIVAALAVAFSGTGVGVAYWLARSDDTTAGATAARSPSDRDPRSGPPSLADREVPATPATATAPAPDAPPQRTPVASLVRVRVRTVPDDALLFLDGERTSNPFDGELPSSAAPRQLEARRRGYRTWIQDLVLRYPQSVTIELRRGVGVDDRRARSTPNPSQGAPSPAPAPAPPAASEPSTQHGSATRPAGLSAPRRPGPPPPAPTGVPAPTAPRPAPAVVEPPPPADTMRPF